MTRVYVDLEVLSTRGGARRPVDVGAVDPAAFRLLDHLVEAGHELVLVAEPPIAPGAVAGLTGTLAELAEAAVAAAPREPGTAAWYLTSDPDRCRGRSARLRTILVGRSPEPTAIHRCDSLARDVRAAVLEILAAEAMPAG
ncbi:MAG TPA: hypothetical protein VFV53_10615 [Candidatus Limnocylindrales bacterium]|nr:hypothetical protein [Candidatus Limnocylindrales bacterium]